EFIEALERSGDVVRIQREVDWDLEAAAIAGRVCELRSPAPFFERIKGCAEGRILGAPIATFRRLAVALGLDPSTPPRELHAEYERRIEQPIKPVMVKDGPCQERAMLGDEIDLYRLPAPMVHDGDGGRYIGTWHLMVSRDPDTGWTNWGMYRLMIHNRTNLVGLLEPFQHLGMVLYSKYIPKGEPMPVAVVLGADQLCCLVAATSFQIGEDEVDYAGALRQEPVELVKCQTNDLLVPAHAEVVIEGEILPDRLLPEGPFGEYPGYRTHGAALMPAIRVTAITYRSHPINCMSVEGVGVPDSRIGPSLTGAVQIKRRLRRHEIAVTDVYIPPEMSNLVAVVGVRSGQSDVASRVMDVLHGRRALLPKIVVVDEDIDVFDLGEVMHAFATRCHPLRGTVARADRQGWTLAPYSSPQEREQHKLATAVYDCTWPADWSKESDIPVRMSFEQAYPQAIRRQVLEEWKSYGFQ
ncbi:MAG: UbiD family decarboxylase, partial [Dehalococcoidia bacterium]